MCDITPICADDAPREGEGEGVAAVPSSCRCPVTLGDLRSRMVAAARDLNYGKYYPDYDYVQGQAELIARVTLSEGEDFIRVVGPLCEAILGR